MRTINTDHHTCIGREQSQRIRLVSDGQQGARCCSSTTNITKAWCCDGSSRGGEESRHDEAQTGQRYEGAEGKEGGLRSAPASPASELNLVLRRKRLVNNRQRDAYRLTNSNHSITNIEMLCLLDSSVS